MNNFNANPILIDTVMGASWRSTVVPFVGVHPLRPRQVYWYNPVSPGDLFQIVDPTEGNMVRLEGRCESADQSQWFPIPGYVAWRDFTVSTLTSGTLLIFY